MDLINVLSAEFWR